MDGDVPDDDEIARAIKNMKNGKAAGDDGVAVEALKYGGPRLQQEVCRIVKEMWVKASLSEYGHEADDWPSEWKVAIQVPLWKRKGKNKDKNTWRGITLLSVGTKVIASVVATRSQKWTESFLAEEQMGFRGGRGIDDVLQVSRRICEEVVGCRGEDRVVVSLFDIEGLSQSLQGRSLVVNGPFWGRCPLH